MATQRQIEANRRNAQKSTGPRSALGRRLSAQNSLKHGLNLRISFHEFGGQIEDLARQIAGPTNSRDAFELAREAAEAELELQRIRQVKTAVIEKSDAAFGNLDAMRESDRKTEAVQDWLPKLTKLFRYEKRQTGRRDKALRKLRVLQKEASSID